MINVTVNISLQDQLLAEIDAERGTRYSVIRETGTVVAGQAMNPLVGAS